MIREAFYTKEEAMKEAEKLVKENKGYDMVMEDADCSMFSWPEEPGQCSGEVSSVVVRDEDFKAVAQFAWWCEDEWHEFKVVNVEYESVQYCGQIFDRAVDALRDALKDAEEFDEHFELLCDGEVIYNSATGVNNLKAFAMEHTSLSERGEDDVLEGLV